MFVFLISIKVYKHNIKHKKYILNNIGIAQNATAYQQQEAQFTNVDVLWNTSHL